MRTLTARLLVITIGLVVVVVALIAATTTTQMRSRLTDQLDAQIEEAARPFTDAGPGRRPDGFEGPDHAGFGNVSPGTLVSTPGGDVVITGRGFAEDQVLDDEQADIALTTASQPDMRTVDIPGVGRYRIHLVSDGGEARVIGMPTDEIDETLASLRQTELVVGLLGILAAAAAAWFVVRRQLAPLREVAATARRVSELPLATGDIAIEERVPSRLADDNTEVGRVGSALNTMLDHVEGSLGARHRSEQQVRQFVADASHELRTPLATIAGYTELARRRPETTEQALGKVEGEAGRMTALVEDLLLLARLDAGRPLAHEPVDLTRMLLEAVADARVLAPDHTWHLDLPDEPVEVVGDAGRLHQVVTNLLANARKYTPAETTITVTARPDGFAVHDDGPGFDAELAAHAFERFVRGDSARTRAGSGAGLGLSLVRAIVAAHGGEVSLRSQPGDTTIDVRLPQ